jgi:hypothetical protein
MVAVAQGDVWWAELPDPAESGPGFRRPVVGIGISIARASKREFRIEVRQNFGLTDLMPQRSEFTVKNRSVDLSFALLL